MALSSDLLLSPIPQDFADTVVLDNTVRAWGMSIVVTLLVFAGLAVARRVAVRRAVRLLERPRNQATTLLLRTICATGSLVVVATALWIGTRSLVLPETARLLLRVFFVAAVALQVTRWAFESLDTGIGLFVRHLRDKQGDDDTNLTAAAPAVRFLVRLAVIVLVVVLVLQNLGVDVTAMITGLGIGGVAVALALQNILGDLFGSLSILLDKPFVVGDFVVVGSTMGTIERIGLKTTRIRALSGEQLVVANSDLLSSRIQNFKRMQQRRAQFSLGVTYQTPLDTVAKLPAVIRECIESQQGVRFERAHFMSFGDSALQLEGVYWVLSPDMTRHMDLQQEIFLAIGRRFASLGVEFAYPTRTVHLAPPAVVSPAGDRASA